MVRIGWHLKGKGMIGLEQIALLKGQNKTEILQELVAIAAGSTQVVDADQLLRAIMDRENQYTTAIGLGIAVPHARTDAVHEQIIVFGRSQSPIECEALDGIGVSIFILIAVTANGHKEYIRMLARAARFLKNEDHRQAIMEAADENQLFATIRAM